MTANLKTGDGYTVAPVAEPGQASANVRPEILRRAASQHAAQYGTQDTANLRPEFLRLPKTGTLCPVTGLSRSYLNGLILPTEANGHCPPVKSVCLRQRGAKKGVRIIACAALLEYLYAHLETSGTEAQP